MTKKGNLMVPRFPKKEILMAYVSNTETTLEGYFQKRKFDGLCKQIMWLSKKKGNFDGLHKCSKNHFGTIISFFGNFDGLYKQVMWPTNSQKALDLKLHSVERALANYVS